MAVAFLQFLWSWWALNSRPGSEGAAGSAAAGSPLFLLIVAAFIASLLTSNIIAIRIVSFGEAPLIGDVIVTSAIVVFPLSYIVGDVLTEVYGYAAARRVIWAGFAANLLMVIAIYAAGLIPAASDWEDQAAYDAILGFTGRLLIASFIAYVIGSFTNAYILARLKIRTRGQMLWLRTISSTVGGQALDTFFFTFIAFLGVLSIGDVWRIFFMEWLLKVLYESAATPITYAVVGYLKRREGIDVYDESTNMNPLAVR